MQRDIVDPAPLRIGREHADLALGVEATTLPSSPPVTMRLPSEAAHRMPPPCTATGDRLCLAGDHEDIFLGSDKGRVLAEEMHGAQGRADRKARTLSVTETMEADSPGSNSVIT